MPHTIFLHLMLNAFPTLRKRKDYLRVHSTPALSRNNGHTARFGQAAYVLFGVSTAHGSADPSSYNVTWTHPEAFSVDVAQRQGGKMGTLAMLTTSNPLISGTHIHVKLWSTPVLAGTIRLSSDLARSQRRANSQSFKCVHTCVR